MTSRPLNSGFSLRKEALMHSASVFVEGLQIKNEQHIIDYIQRNPILNKTHSEYHYTLIHSVLHQNYLKTCCPLPFSMATSFWPPSPSPHAPVINGQSLKVRINQDVPSYNVMVRRFLARNSLYIFHRDNLQAASTILPIYITYHSHQHKRTLEVFASKRGAEVRGANSKFYWL